MLNTCCIRENADNKLYGNLGHLKQLKAARPDLQIVVAGCLAQKDRERGAGPGAARRRRARHPQRAPGRRAAGRGPRRRTGHRDLGRRRRSTTTSLFPSALPARREASYRAWVTIQIGCDNTCAFCIVPAVRGPEVSRPFADIVDEVDAPGRRRRHRGDAARPERQLLRPRPHAGRPPRRRRRRAGPAAVRRPPAGRRQRPRHPPGPLHQPAPEGPPARDGRWPWPRRRRCASTSTCRCRPGRDRVLAAMHRGYTAERYLERLAAARAAIADLAVTTDLIVGFPGETDDDFAAHARGRRRRRVRLRLHVHLLAPARHRGGGDDRRVRRPGHVRRAVRAPAGRRRAQRAGPPPGPHRPRRGGARRGPEQEGRRRHHRPHPPGQARALPPAAGRCGPAPTPTSRSPTPPRTTCSGGSSRSRPGPPTAPASRWSADLTGAAGGRHRRPDGVGQVGRGHGRRPSPGRRRDRRRRRLPGVPRHGHRHGQADRRPTGPRSATTASIWPTRRRTSPSSTTGAPTTPPRPRSPPAASAPCSSAAPGCTCGGRSTASTRPAPGPPSAPSWKPNPTRPRSTTASGTSIRPPPPRWSRPTGAGSCGRSRWASAAASRSAASAPGSTAYPPDAVVQFGLRWPRAELTRRIERRFGDLLAAGFLDEVRTLAARPRGLSRTAAQAIGYAELLDDVAGRTSLADATAAPSPAPGASPSARNGGSGAIPGFTGSTSTTIRSLAVPTVLGAFAACV